MPRKGVPELPRPRLNRLMVSHFEMIRTTLCVNGFSAEFVIVPAIFAEVSEARFDPRYGVAHAVTIPTSISLLLIYRLARGALF